MKNFLTKAEACAVLKKLEDSEAIEKKDAIALASIRVCIIAEEKGFNLWGKFVEDARPIFRECEIPDENASEEMIANYEAYKMCYADACKKLMTNWEE